MADLLFQIDQWQSSKDNILFTADLLIQIDQWQSSKDNIIFTADF
jgi:hypothetical protein